MAPRNKESNQQILDQRREQILAAALKMFALRGFAATKISDIASAAGLSHGLIYHYFKSKNEIFTELVKIATSIFLEIIKYGARYDVSPLEKIRSITEMIISLSYSRDHAYYLSIAEQAYISDEVPAEAKSAILGSVSSNLKLIAAMIVEGQNTGQIIEDDPERLAFAYFSMVRGMTGMQSKMNAYAGFPSSFSDADILVRAFKNP
jgi:AcrR family transcriptional regulator